MATALIPKGYLRIFVSEDFKGNWYTEFFYNASTDRFFIKTMGDEEQVLGPLTIQDLKFIRMGLADILSMKPPYPTVEDKYDPTLSS